MGGYTDEELNKEYQKEVERRDWIDALHMASAILGSNRNISLEQLKQCASNFYDLIQGGPRTDTVIITKQFLWELRECARASGASNRILDDATRLLGEDEDNGPLVKDGNPCPKFIHHHENGEVGGVRP